MVLLDSTTCVVPGTNELCENDDGAGSENQYEWLQGQLSGDQGDCVGASFHHPVWSSSTAGEPQDMGPIYDLLDDAGGVDIVLSGHRHSYERFPKQSINLSTHLPFLEGDAPKQFVVGTGGEGTNDVISPAQLNSQLQIEAHGGLMLTLHAHDFEYSFDPIESNPETVPAGHADDDVTPAMINCTNDD